MKSRVSQLKRRLLVEQLAKRLVMANVAGLVFEDTNGSWRLESTESALSSRLVFVDSNDNAQFDEDERFALTAADGRFEFQDLSGDETIIRLFSGAASANLPSFPVAADTSAPVISLSGASSLVDVGNNSALSLGTNSVFRSDLASGNSTEIPFVASVRAASRLPGGRILVLASDDLGNHSFLIDVDNVVTPLDLQTPLPQGGWADVAIDSSGNGLLVEQSDDDSFLRGIVVGDTITVGTSTTTVGAGTRVIGGGNITSVIATPTDDGLQLRLWSNATGTEIGSGGIDVPGAVEVLSFDDASGLVLLRNANDSLTLLDADAEFAALQTVSDLPGPAVLDPARELLYAISPADSLLHIIDVNSAATLALLALDAETISMVADLLLDPATGKLITLTAAGLAPIALQRSDAHHIRTATPDGVFDIVFALPPAANENTPPQFDELPEFVTPEDTPLVVPAPELLEHASDVDGDSFVIVLDTQAEHGAVLISPQGGLIYIPEQDFFGVDRFKVVLHDGRDVSEPFEFTITVTPVNDPLGFDITPNVIPENPILNFIAGIIQVINVDGGQVVWNIDDPRFQVQDDIIVIVPGSLIDYEVEPSITVNITATELASSETATDTVTFSVSDQLETIREILPDSAVIDENLPGELIAEIVVVNDADEQEYEFSVDDERFVIDFRDLRLKPGISLDYEAEPSVTVNITARGTNGSVKTEPLVITVRDIGEQASSVALSSQTVLELVRGAAVGDVIVDGNILGAGYIATVDDSRFEVSGSRLKLRTSEFVRYADQEEIQVVITILDAAASFLPITGTFVLTVRLNENPFHNTSNPYDVNGDNRVTTSDALRIINSIHRNGGPGPISDFPSPDRFYDVNGDGRITPLDALLVINYLNRLYRGGGFGNGEGEQSPPPANSAPSVAGAVPAISNQRTAAPEIVATELPTKRADTETQVPLSQVEPPATTSAAYAEAAPTADQLVKLRDEVVDLLASDQLSDRDEVESAINDLLGSNE